MINFEELIKVLISPLVVFPEDINVVSNVSDEGYLNFDVTVNQQDVGRVIGKGGGIISSVRTILNAAATKEDKRIRLNLIVE